MTNLDYIMQNMTERDVVDFVLGNNYALSKDVGELAEKAYHAFSTWASNIAGCAGNMYFIDDVEHQPNVYNTEIYYFYKGTRDEYRHLKGYDVIKCEIANSKNCNAYAIPRAESLSMQVWLSKQYNADEWVAME